MTDRVSSTRGQVGLRKELNLLQLTVMGLVGAVGTGILFSAPRMMTLNGLRNP